MDDRTTANVRLCERATRPKIHLKRHCVADDVADLLLEICMLKQIFAIEQVDTRKVGKKMTTQTSPVKQQAQSNNNTDHQTELH